MKHLTWLVVGDGEKVGQVGQVVVADVAIQFLVSLQVVLVVPHVGFVFANVAHFDVQLVLVVAVSQSCAIQEDLAEMLLVVQMR